MPADLRLLSLVPGLWFENSGLSCPESSLLPEESRYVFGSGLRLFNLEEHIENISSSNILFSATELDYLPDDSTLDSTVSINGCFTTTTNGIYVFYLSQLAKRKQVTFPKKQKNRALYNKTK